MQIALNQCKEDLNISTNEIISEQIKINQYLSEELNRLTVIH